MLYFIFLLHYLFQKLKQLFKPKNYYKSKKRNNQTFIPFRSHNKKPSWVKDELIYLKVHLPKYGCRKIAKTFNRKFVHTEVTVSKSYLYNILKANNYEIIKQRKKLKNRVPKPMSKNPTLKGQVLVTPIRGIQCLSPKRCQGNSTLLF